MAQKKDIKGFRDARLADFFAYSTPHRKIPAKIHTTLSRELDTINTATSHWDLCSSPGNRYEESSRRLREYSSIRVNKQYRLISKWADGKAEELFPDPHNC